MRRMRASGGRRAEPNAGSHQIRFYDSNGTLDSFYAGDGGEPPHVHVRRDRFEAKFWLEPVQVAANLGFADQELNRIRRLVVEHAGTLMEAWHDYFAS